MGMEESCRYYVLCDRCRDDADASDDEDQAVSNAERDGFKQVTGHKMGYEWLCATCFKKEERELPKPLLTPKQAEALLSIKAAFALSWDELTTLQTDQAEVVVAERPYVRHALEDVQRILQQG